MQIQLFIGSVLGREKKPFWEWSELTSGERQEKWEKGYVIFESKNWRGQNKVSTHWFLEGHGILGLFLERKNSYDRENVASL